MRCRTVAALVVLLLPLAMAQEEHLSEDDAGDVNLHGPDGGVVAVVPPDHMRNMDLTAMGIADEDPQQIAFYVDVVDLQQQSESNLPFGDPQYFVHFRYHEVAYRVQAYLFLDNAAGAAGQGENMGHLATLQEHDGERWRSVSDVEALPDWEEDRLTLVVPKDVIVDEDHAPLERGALLTELHVRTTAMGFFDMRPEVNGQEVGGRSPYAQDLLPDTGFAPDYTVRTGLDLQRGALFSVSDDPVRWTNGEATTLRFTVNVVNRGDAPVEAAVSTEGTPSTWVAAHADIVEVPAQGSVNATVLVTIPFSHAHGTTQEFFAVFRSGMDFSKTRLGVHWPAIPQPAGHHDTLFFHAAHSAPRFPVFDRAFPSTFDWMNAASAEVDTDDEGIAARATVVSPPFAGEQMQALWDLQLSPGLRMGLDFDLSRQGTLSATVETSAPVADATATAELFLRRTSMDQDGRGSTSEATLLASGASATLEGAQNGPLRFEFPLDVEPDADLIPYDPAENGNLVLRISMSGVMPPGAAFGPEGLEPRLSTAASSLALPLFEYHDPVDFSGVTDRALVVGDVPSARDVNPGRGVLYRVPVQYDGGFKDTFELHLTGTNRDWGSIIGDTVFRMEPGGERELALLVAAPEDARAGEVADITLTMRSRSNGAVEAHVRTVTSVVTGMDIPDERQEAEELSGSLSAKDSPGLGVAAAVAVATLAGLRRRR